MKIMYNISISLIYVKERNVSIIGRFFKWLNIELFEILYVAISVATFSHTQWAAAFAFEGTPPTSQNELNIWYLKGALVAIAVDAGMFLSAKYIKTRVSLTMVVAFIIAAIVSFYTQTLYIYYHTPSFPASAGVTQYWREALDPLVDARVFLIPFFLPFLGIIYTTAQIGHHVKETRKNNQDGQSESSLISMMNQKVIIEKDAKDMGEERQATVYLPKVSEHNVPEEVLNFFSEVDFDNKTFIDPRDSRLRGPYRTPSLMIANMKTMYKKQQKKLAKGSES